MNGDENMARLLGTNKRSAQPLVWVIIAAGVAVIAAAASVLASMVTH
jgi:fumarate reductase subunit D